MTTVRARHHARVMWLAAALSLLFLVPAVPAGQASAAAPVGTHPFADGRAVSPGDDFPTFLGDLERTSSSGEQQIGLANASTLHPLWSYNAGDEGVQSQPVEQNGVTYFGGRTGYEYAVDGTTGALRWQTYLGQDSNDSGCNGGFGVTSSATVVGPELYVDGGYPYLYDLNSTTGAIEWRAAIGGSADAGYYDWSSPLIYRGDAYIGISSFCDQPLVAAGLAEYSLTTHAVVGYFNTSVPAVNGSSIWSSPSVNAATNTIFVTTGNAYSYDQSTYSESVIALNASTLTVEATWQLPPQAETVDGDFGVTPTLFTPSSGVPMATAANKNGVLYAFDQSNLTLVWNRTVCCQNHTYFDHISTAWGGGFVYAVGSQTQIGGVMYNSSVWAFNPLTGATEWVRGFSESSQDGYAAPLWVDQLLIVPDQGEILVLNADNGSTLYQYTAPGWFVAPASISRGEIYAASENGHVYAFDLALGATATESQPVGTPPLTDSFGVTGSGGLPPYSYSWTFGDGQSSTLPDPEHTYSTLGSYEVNVSVTDLAGNVSVEHLVVEVKAGVEVIFDETGLPPGTNWSVVLGGTTQSSTTAEITFVETNGSYAYAVGARPGFSVVPSSGELMVDGAPFRLAVQFTPVSGYLVTFTETGLPFGTNWSVTINGTVRSSETPTIVVALGNGTYAFIVGAAASRAPSPSTGAVTVSGGPVSVSVSFVPETTCTPGCGPPIRNGFPGPDDPSLVLGGLVAVGVIASSWLVWSRRRRKGPPPVSGSTTSAGPETDPPPP